VTGSNDTPKIATDGWVGRNWLSVWLGGLPFDMAFCRRSGIKIQKTIVLKWNNFSRDLNKDLIK
jgi:hypothetical protein